MQARRNNVSSATMSLQLASNVFFNPATKKSEKIRSSRGQRVMTFDKPDQKVIFVVVTNYDRGSGADHTKHTIIPAPKATAQLCENERHYERQDN
jgi:hypothetical protein